MSPTPRFAYDFPTFSLTGERSFEPRIRDQTPELQLQINSVDELAELGQGEFEEGESGMSGMLVLTEGTLSCFFLEVGALFMRQLLLHMVFWLGATRDLSFVGLFFLDDERLV